jgi:hypothetical protein
LLTELLTDGAPYASSDPTELCELVFHAERPSPARCGVDVGPWQPIIERAVSLKPARRFADVASLAVALEQTIDQATLAFASRASRMARVVSPRPARLLATDMTQSEETASDTFPGVSSERRGAGRSRLAAWRSHRSMSGLATFAVIAAGCYFVFTGLRSTDTRRGASSATTASSTRSRSAPSDSRVNFAIQDIETAVDDRSTEPLPAQTRSSANLALDKKPMQASPALRRPASIKVAPVPPASSAQPELPAYVVE